MKSRIKLIISFINLFRLFPHVLLFLYNRQRYLYDVLVAKQHHIIECNNVLGLLYLLTFDTTFRNLFYYRTGNLSYFIKWLCPPHNSFIIATYSKIGEGFLGVHPVGTFVNAKSIGNFFTVKNNVTIGNNHEMAPSIGDYVTINAGAIVVGDISVGNNVQIGAGSVVTKSVPDNCTVVGNPAFIIKENGHRVNKKL